MKILFCGDTHGDTDNLKLIIDTAILNDCVTIMVVGDFGIWGQLEECKNFIPDIQHYAEEHGVFVHFIRGNHDDTKYLKTFTKGSIHTTPITENIIYHPNGDVWNFDELKLFAAGGAISCDKHRRTLGIDYFADEGIQFDDIGYSLLAGKCDIVVSHDAPFSSDIDSYFSFNQGVLELENRRMLQRICENVKPTMVIHGHYHMPMLNTGSYRGVDGYVKMECLSLGYNYNYNTQFKILDTKDAKWDYKNSY